MTEFASVIDHILVKKFIHQYAENCCLLQPFTSVTKYYATKGTFYSNTSEMNE